ALRPRWHAQDDTAGHRGNIDVGTEDELRIGRQHLGVQVFAVALEAWIVGDLEHYVHVTTRPAARANVSDSAQRHVLTRRDTAGNVDGYFSIGADTAVAPALLARRADDAPFTLARGTGLDGDELSEERALGALHLARPATAR